MILPKNHFSLTQASAVSQLCEPLFKHTEINHFTYSRIYNDGRLLVLVNDANNHQHFWDRKYNRQHFLKCKEGVTFLQSRSTPALCDAQEYFNIDYPIILTTKKEDYFESITFATRRGNTNILEFYVNNMEVLRLFITYFKEKADDLIAQAESTLITSGVTTDEIPKNRWAVDKNNLMNQIKPKRYEFTINKNRIFLTRMEYLTLERIAHGDTAKMSGKYLGVSYKTIEKYIELIKTKFHCNSKGQLLEIFFSNI